MRFTHQELHGLGDAQQNFEQLEAMNLLQVLSTQALQVAFGAAVVTWTGGVLFSNVKSTAHGLGRTPVAYAVFANGTTSVTNQNFQCSGTNVVLGAQSVSVDGTNITYRGWSLQANPNAAETGNVLWIAIG